MEIKNQPGKFGIQRIVVFQLILVLLLFACSVPPPVVAASTSDQPVPEIIISPTPFAPGKAPEVTGMPTRTDALKIPDPGNYQWVTAFSGFTQPVDLVSPPGDPAKIIVVEQPGVIRLILNGKTSHQPFMDIETG